MKKLFYPYIQALKKCNTLEIFPDLKQKDVVWFNNSKNVHLSYYTSCVNIWF